MNSNMNKWLSIFITSFGALSIGSITYAQSTPGNQYQSHNFQYMTGVLTSANRSTQSANAWNALNPPKWYTMNVTTTASGFSVTLEGSLDNANWSPIAVTNSALGNISNTVPLPYLYFRMRAGAIAAGTSITPTAIGVW